MTDGAHDHLTVPAHTHPAPDLSGYATNSNLDAVVSTAKSTDLALAGAIDALSARVKALEVAKWAIPGFRLAFFDDYSDRTILRGHMGDVIKGNYSGAVYADRYLWNTWPTNYGGGIYDLGQAEIANGVLDILIETKTAVPFGKTMPFTGPWVAGFKPVADVADLTRGGAITGPFIMEFRVRADLMPGFKGVPMLWTGRNWKTEPAAGYTFLSADDPKWPDGEIDIIEGSFDKQPAVYIHHSWVQKTDAASVYQAYFPTPTGTNWQDWHTYRVVFYPSGTGGTWTPKVEVWQDGVLLGRVTDKVPGNFPFRPNFQFEPNLVGTAPATTVRGHVQIDHIAVWVPGVSA